MIWEAAVFPRIVHLERVGHGHTCSRVGSEAPFEGPHTMCFFYMDNQPMQVRTTQVPEPYYSFQSRSVPSLFFACRESHLVARTIYTKSFGTDYVAPSTWFNFEVDILYLDWDHGADGEYSVVEFSFGPEHLNEDIRKVRNLAIYDGKYPDNIMSLVFINKVLTEFGNVKNLMFVPSYDPPLDEDCATLVFLDKWDVMESLVWAGDEELYHPIFVDEFPELEDEDHLFWESKALWSQRSYERFANLNESPTSDGGRRWEKPNIQRKPMVTLPRKLDFLQRRQEYDMKRDAHRTRVTVTAQDHNSLELFVPLLTTMEEIATMFCQARNLDFKVEDEDDWVDILEVDRQGSFESICHDSSVSNFKNYPDTDLTLELVFYETRRICDCEYIHNYGACHHVERYRQRLWMEYEGWTLRILLGDMSV